MNVGCWRITTFVHLDEAVHCCTHRLQRWTLVALRSEHSRAVNDLESGGGQHVDDAVCFTIGSKIDVPSAFGTELRRRQVRSVLHVVTSRSHRVEFSHSS